MFFALSIHTMRALEEFHSGTILVLMDVEKLLCSKSQTAVDAAYQKWYPNESLRKIAGKRRHIPTKTKDLQKEHVLKNKPYSEKMHLIWPFIEGKKEQPLPGQFDQWVDTSQTHWHRGEGPLEMFARAAGPEALQPVEGTKELLKWLNKLKKPLAKVGIELHIGSASNMGQWVRHIFSSGPKGGAFERYIEEPYCMDVTLEKVALKLWKPKADFFSRGLADINSMRAHEKRPLIPFSHVILVDTQPESIAGAREAGIDHIVEIDSSTPPSEQITRAFHGIAQKIQALTGVNLLDQHTLI